MAAFCGQVQHSEGASKLAGRLGALGPGLLFAWQTQYLETFGCSLRGRCSTQREPENSLDVWALSVRGTLCVAGAALGDSVAALCVAGAVLGDSFAALGVGRRSTQGAIKLAGRLGALSPQLLCVAGALGDSVAALCMAGAVLGDSVVALCVAGAVLREGRPTRWMPGRSRSAALCVAGAVLGDSVAALRGRRSTWRLCGCSLRGRCSTQRDPANLLDSRSAAALCVAGAVLLWLLFAWQV